MGHSVKQKSSPQSGFMLAPLLYMLALGGIGAAVMFSGYSQVLRSNSEMAAISAARQQLSSAGQTLSATSTIDGTNMLKPPVVKAFSGAQGVAVADQPKLPAYASGADITAFMNSVAPSANNPAATDIGVLDNATGLRQLDPWGKYYIYCRWNTLSSNGNYPAVMVVSAGPDGILQTACNDTVAKGDDRINRMTAAETINRANVWQVNAGNSVATYGIGANAVQVDTNAGTLTVKNLTVTGSATIPSATISAGTMSGVAISGGTITSTPITEGSMTISAAGAVAGAAISGGSMTTTALTGVTIGDITTPSVVHSTITNATVTNGTMTGTALTGVTIGDAAGPTHSSITNATISNGTIDSAAISNGTISGAGISGGTISGTPITEGTMTISAAGVIAGSTINSPTISGTIGGSPTITSPTINNGSTNNTTINVGTGKLYVNGSTPTLDGVTITNSTAGAGSTFSGGTAGGVTGGTANYIPLWSNATTLTSSAMYQNGSNIGIGNTNAAQKLDVTGYIAVRSINGEGGTIQLQGNNASNLWLENNNGYFRLVNSAWSAEFYKVDQSGNETVYGNSQINGAITVNSTSTLTGSVGVGGAPTGYKFTTNGDIYANGGWLRVSGNQGLYFESWGGGWYMQDGTWIRSYNSKPVYMSAGFDTGSPAAINCSGSMAAGYNFRVCGTEQITGSSTISGGLNVSNRFNLNGAANDWAAVVNWGPGAVSGGYGILVGHAGGRYSQFQNAEGYYTLLAYSSWGAYSNGNAGFANFYHVSDRRLKENIKQSPGLEIVTKLKGVSFTWKKDGTKSDGVIAQDIEEVMPEAVTKTPEGMKTVNYDVMFAPIIESIKELKGMLDKLADKVAELFKRVDTHDAEIKALQEELKKLHGEFTTYKAAHP